MGESENQRITVMITRTPIPVLYNLMGAELHHAEWSAGTNKDMPMTARTNVGVDKGCVILLVAA